MKLSKVTLAMAAILGTGAPSTIFALDLYVDKKTQQIFATPGPGRVHLGSFVKEDAEAKATGAGVAAGTGIATGASVAAEQAEAVDVAALRKDIEMKAKMREARLVSDMASLEERVKESEKVHIEFHDGAPHFASKDGNFTFAVNGRAQIASQYNFINDFGARKWTLSPGFALILR